MPINKVRLQRAKSLISIDEGKAIRTGAFADVGNELHMLKALASSRGDVVDPRMQRVTRPLQYIAKDLWNIETLFERLQWQHEQWNADQLPDSVWFRFASADIDMFHVECRSLFDYVAQVLRAVSDKFDQIPDKSFEKLRNWASASESNRKKLGTDIASLLENCDWFADVRAVRDDVVHRGGETLVFLDKPSFCFQTYQGHQKKVMFSEVMVNANIVDFERYGGVVYGYLLSFLEDVAQIIFHRFNVKRNPGRSIHHGPGIAVGYNWIVNVLEIT